MVKRSTMCRYFVFVLSITYITQALRYTSINTFYNNLGCEEIIGNTETGSTTTYNCSKIEKLKNQCHFLGKYFNPNEKIKETEEFCQFGCRCNREGKIECAQHDCPEFYTQLENDCFWTSGFQCCPETVVCNRNLTTCLYNNKTYIEGVTFYPEECTECVCQKGFKGKLEEPFCRKQKCFASEEYYNSFLNKCAPVFVENNCCPISFNCDDENEATTTRAANITEHTCQFRKNIFNIGDEIKLKVAINATCKCIAPPLITCQV